MSERIENIVKEVVGVSVYADCSGCIYLTLKEYDIRVDQDESLYRLGFYKPESDEPYEMITTMNLTTFKKLVKMAWDETLVVLPTDAD